MARAPDEQTLSLGGATARSLRVIFQDAGPPLALTDGGTAPVERQSGD